MTIVWIVALGAVGIQLLTLLPNLWLFPVLKPASGTSRRQVPVSILIPARNEADNLPQTLASVLRQPEAAEVLVLDDCSTDTTAEVLAEFAGKDNRLRVLHGAPLPDGWTGKNWACTQLARQATGEILAFTDADVTWGEGALAAVLADLEQHDAGLMSVWPQQTTDTLFERLFLPWINLAVLSWLPYWAVQRRRDPRYSAANGQLMVWRREAYQRAGTHAAVRDSSQDDVPLARRAKAAGCRLHLALAPTLLATRMYRNGGEMIAGIGRNLRFFTGGSNAGMFVAVALYTLIYTAWLPLAWVDPRWWWVGALAALQHLGGYAKMRRPWYEALLFPLFFVPLWCIAWYAWRARGRYSWKDRAVT